MNALTDEQYERIARYLDGEPVALTEAELDAARRMQADEGILAAALPVPVDPAMTERVWRRVRPGRALWRHTQYALYGAAAAAAVLLVAVLVNHWLARPVPPVGGGSGTPVVRDTAVDDAYTAVRTALDRDLATTESHMASFRTPVAPAGLDESDDDASDTHSVPTNGGGRG